MVVYEEAVDYDDLVHLINSGEATCVSLEQEGYKLEPISVYHANCLRDALKGNKSVVNLRMSQCKLGNVGAKALAEGLMENDTLFNLDVSDNYVTAEGGKALASALKVNKALWHFNIGRNHLFGEGVTEFAEALKVNKSLRELELHCVDMDSESALKIDKAFDTNDTVTILDIHGNKIDSDILARIKKKVHQNHLKADKDLAKKTEVGEALAKQGLGQYQLAFFKGHVYTKRQIQRLTPDQLTGYGEMKKVEAEKLKEFVGYSDFELTPVGKLLGENHLSEYARRFFKKGHHEPKPMELAEIEKLGVHNKEHQQAVYNLFSGQ